jgi:hypothetical protein
MSVHFCLARNTFALLRAKLNIIEQEFKYAEKTEFWRMKEEEDMRRTIQVQILSTTLPTRHSLTTLCTDQARARSGGR